MTQKDYTKFAEVLGEALARALVRGGEQARTLVYETVYEPLTNVLAADNPRFDRTKFAFYTAQAEQRYDITPRRTEIVEA